MDVSAFLRSACIAITVSSCLTNISVPSSTEALLGAWKTKRADGWQREAHRFWIAALLFNIAGGSYSLWRLRARQLQQQQQDAVAEKSAGRDAADARKSQREAAAARLQLVSDLCDLTIPLSGTGLANLDDGIVGIAGTISSLIGTWSQWRKSA